MNLLERTVRCPCCGNQFATVDRYREGFEAGAKAQREADIRWPQTMQAMAQRQGQGGVAPLVTPREEP